MAELKECEHKYIHYRTDAFSERDGYNIDARKYTVIEYFFCEKCAEIKEVTKSSLFGRFEQLPGWAKAITDHRY